jgi:hypothetical protein
MGDKTWPFILTVLIILAIFALLGIGWRNRIKRQSDVPDLPEVPAEFEPQRFEAAGQYVVTTKGGDWLDRIAAHGLGVRTNATMHVHPEGVVIERSGAGTIYIAKDSLREVRTESGMAGKFVERGGLVVVTWMLGQLEVDTGFRTTAAEAKPALVAALKELLPDGGTQDSPDAGLNGKNN